MLYYRKNFKYHRVKLYVILIAIGMAYLLFRGEHHECEKERVEVNKNVCFVDSSMCFSPDNLMRYIKESGIRFPEIVYRQALLESGRFTSNIYTEANNLFGMKVAKQRPTTAIGEFMGHARYKSWMSSVQDYALFQSAYMRDCKTEEDYYKKLGRTYAEDNKYVTLLKNIKL
jgi:hypothetical protein